MRPHKAVEETTVPSTGDSPSRAMPEPGEEPARPIERRWPPEIGGPEGLEPTRYGDWERRGRCIDF